MTKFHTMNKLVLFSFTLFILVFNSCKKKDDSEAAKTCSTPAPQASSNGPVGIGDTLKLTAQSVSGASYYWKGPNGFASTAQNPFVLNYQQTNSGDYIVTATIDGCTSVGYHTYVNTCKTIATSNTPVTLGTTLNLMASNVLDYYGTVVPATYSWAGPNGFTSTLQNPSISITTMSVAGTYSVIATTNTGHNSLKATVVVVIQPPAPTVKSNTVIVGATLTFSLTSANLTGATYSWTGPNGFTSAQQNPTIPSVTKAATGVYTAKYILNGVESIGATKYVYVKYSNSGCGGQTSFLYDGYTYNVVEIGTQCWMSENLRNVITASLVTTAFSWNGMVAPNAVADSQGVCPVGWHLPSDVEFQNLSLAAGNDGNALKAVGQGTLTGAGTNTSGFSAIITGTNTAASYWSISEVSTQLGKIMKLPQDNSLIISDSKSKADVCCGIRCIKD